MLSSDDLVVTWVDGSEMSKQVYISADYDIPYGDRDVVDELNKWGQDNLHKVDFIDMSKTSSGSVANDPDCRICDLKKEFNRQINASSAVIFVVGDRTASRLAGSGCERTHKDQVSCYCSPYKRNSGGKMPCKVSMTFTPGEYDDLGCINGYSYLRHEFEQAKKKDKPLIIVYNSTRNEIKWLPSYMRGYEDMARPFWKYDSCGRKVGDYEFIKEALGF